MPVAHQRSQRSQDFKTHCGNQMLLNGTESREDKDKKWSTRYRDWKATDLQRVILS